MTIKICNNSRRSAIAVFVIILSAVVLAGCGHVGQDSADEPGTSRIGVMTKDRSYIRLDPVLYSTVVAYTVIGEKVGILDQSSEKTWIGNTSDYWYKIKISGGLTGWTFGTNLKIFSEKDTGEINDFLKDLWKQERRRVLGKLTGRWWSVDKYDNFTNQCVEIYDNGDYKAYTTGGTPVEGEYSIKYRKNEMVFSKGTPFGDRLNYIARGDAYVLRKAGDDTLKFKRIKRKFDDSDAEEKPEEKDAKQDPDK